MAAETLEKIQKFMLDAQKSSRLAAAHITLLGASKSQPAERILDLASKGITVFGENRVQEAEEKWPAIKPQIAGCELHLIGPLQTNKAKKAVALFDVIQSVDRVKLAKAIAEASKEQGKQVGCYLQVNIGKEPQKSGVLPEALPELIGACSDFGLVVDGLMCVPPSDHHPAPYFALLRQMAGMHGLEKLSMGMSNDYEEAIRMGSSCIRLGRSLFGERPAS